MIWCFSEMNCPPIASQYPGSELFKTLCGIPWHSLKPNNPVLISSFWKRPLSQSPMAPNLFFFGPERQGRPQSICMQKNWGKSNQGGAGVAAYPLFCPPGMTDFVASYLFWSFEVIIELNGWKGPSIDPCDIILYWLSWHCYSLSSIQSLGASEQGRLAGIDREGKVHLILI